MENDLYFCLVRNKFIFSNIDQTIHQNIFQFHHLVNEYCYLVNPYTNNQTQHKTILINWSPPSLYVTLYILLMDSGDMQAFTNTLAELWAICFGLEMAWQTGHRYIYFISRFNHSAQTY